MSEDPLSLPNKSKLEQKNSEQKSQNEIINYLVMEILVSMKKHVSMSTCLGYLK